MGQNTHPKGFRLISTQKHLSSWFINKHMYPTFLKEDMYFRERIENEFNVNKILQICNIDIQRQTIKKKIDNKLVHITIKSLYPREQDILQCFEELILNFEDKDLNNENQNLLRCSKEKFQARGLYLIQQRLQNLVDLFQNETKQEISIGLTFLKNPYEDVSLIARFVEEQLKQRIPYRRILKMGIKKAGGNSSVSGIKIEISGRLNGIEMARSEGRREGRIPLHTIRAAIDYTQSKVKTIYGIMGVKVWLFRK